MVSGANNQDSTFLQPMVTAIPAIRSGRYHRDKLRAGKAYNSATRRAWLRERRITRRVAREGIEDPTKLGRHRWRIQRTIGCLPATAG